VLNGDTVYVRGSGLSYGNLTLDKTLHFFGPGYFLGENPDTQANKQDADLLGLTILNGSEGSTFTGLRITSSVDIKTSNISIRRCRIENNSSFYTILIRSNVSNIILAQNIIVNFSTSTSANAIELENSGSSGIVITNNYISAVDDTVEGTGTMLISNNVLDGDLNVYNSTIINNIQGNLVRSTTSTLQGSNNSVILNMGHTAQFGTGNGNVGSVDMSTVFIGASNGSSDGQWQLSVDSPAIEAGFNGQDMGMFGGSAPYVLSGIPAIPSIYSFIAPAIGTAASGLDVTLKTKSNN